MFFFCLFIACRLPWWDVLGLLFEILITLGAIILQQISHGELELRRELRTGNVNFLIVYISFTVYVFLFLVLNFAWTTCTEGGPKVTGWPLPHSFFLQLEPQVPMDRHTSECRGVKGKHHGPLTLSFQSSLTLSLNFLLFCLIF